MRQLPVRPFSHVVDVELACEGQLQVTPLEYDPSAVLIQVIHQLFELLDLCHLHRPEPPWYSNMSEYIVV